ncbi:MULTISPECIES: sensor histidine kinase [Xanthomonas]|uniref:histidine kinase n=1 Tax=Xanthomonas cucurbitae TaxID=56453 RepID=A0A2S7DSU7_9XANT|nr:HWE histidine kinase domain-containing protein [Xanthomonas cucurbitae]PPU76860.1 histidine kinase [Xanthomonas cucurbitae]QHG87838.1 PAS domain S-box protein [Xanthomonas cucurbitae]WDM66708.1 PAS domain-containing protein [Xanthomonas cucurbitae]WDM70585.1 PAS domain-containing protein [Xanthomonas cucurbitae]WDM74455.1 PAS domain-containing protein [Xanthomonas cucurbitae]
MAMHQEDAAKSRIYEALLQAIPDLLYVFDTRHRFVYANQALLTMWGLRWEEACGKTCLELGYEPWHAAMHDREIERVIATGQPLRGEVPFPHSVNGLRIYDYIFTPVFGLDGKVEAIAGATRDITEHTQHAQHLQLLINELNHRVKNSLAMVQSLARQSFANAANLADAHEKIDARLLALSRAHDTLTRENWVGADIQELTRDAAAVYESCDSPRFILQGAPCRLDPRRALALSMALHELCTNALKHGALSADQGRVHIAWELHDRDGRRTLELVWQESGGPAVQPPACRGFGSRLLERGLAHDLKGEAALSFEPGGVRFRVVVPLATAPEALVS